MGTVHGVYLKYVGISAISFVGLTYLTKNSDGSKLSVGALLGESALTLCSSSFICSTANSRALLASDTRVSLIRALSALVLGYSTILNGIIAALFKAEIGMGLLGKDKTTGEIPSWSYVIFFPFHIPTKIYTFIHKMGDDRKKKKVPVASEVQPGWWVGGCYGHELNKDWAGVIDLTVEFPETNITRTRAYLSMPTWDGVPATPEQLEQAANFAVKAKEGGGDILVHCAHGRGRSTTVMCACLVKAGLFATWEEAFEQGIKPGRSVCKLNLRMKQNLAEWQAKYVEPRNKKGQ